MKYMVIIYGNKELWESFPPEVAAKAIGEVDAFNRRYTESGELLGAYGLADELMAKTVRVRDGAPGRHRRAVPGGQGVRVELLDPRLESEERALEFAAEHPFAAANAVEVWPILHESGWTV